ncbi:MAG TPA: hypothetical protein VN986_05505 [Actinomycetota bacterium]|nr:hypothetical protein [Actinomycetota bacterium]
MREPPMFQILSSVPNARLGTADKVDSGTRPSLRMRWAVQEGYVNRILLADEVLTLKAERGDRAS